MKPSKTEQQTVSLSNKLLLPRAAEKTDRKKETPRHGSVVSKNYKIIYRQLTQSLPGPSNRGAQTTTQFVCVLGGRRLTDSLNCHRRIQHSLCCRLLAVLKFPIPT
ncbi:hypothetical protein ZHAS_00020807 [Anopheles sinensis]|uniref:Uncharacterized protein n=1 Tax=Anopheles sinensis TaxID=74873 RepID=A0A084WQQ5_ANOSI|nr:hypothetical protein ZHAS_00020807 [Anopheles sinensis]